MEAEIAGKIEILAEEHWDWLGKLLKTVVSPKDWEMFGKLLKMIYVTAFKHGAKHNEELKCAK